MNPGLLTPHTVSGVCDTWVPLQQGQHPEILDWGGAPASSRALQKSQGGVVPRAGLSSVEPFLAPWMLP